MEITTNIYNWIKKTIFLEGDHQQADLAQHKLHQQLDQIQAQHDLHTLNLQQINQAVQDIKQILSETGNFSRRGRSETLEILFKKLYDMDDQL